MIRGHSDHAANERTFLAWVRVGIAAIGFGFVVEKFNLSGPLGRYNGLALVLLGTVLVVVAVAGSNRGPADYELLQADQDGRARFS